MNKKAHRLIEMRITDDDWYKVQKQLFNLGYGFKKSGKKILEKTHRVNTVKGFIVCLKTKTIWAFSHYRYFNEIRKLKWIELYPTYPNTELYRKLYPDHIIEGSKLRVKCIT
jgi:hypothetical protein